MSIEVDIMPIADGNEETARLADVIEGVAGEFSPFEELHGFSIDGVDLHTSILPQGWRNRLVRSRTPTPPRPRVSRSSPAGAWTRKTSAWLAALEKDRRFVAALIRAGLVDPGPSSPGCPRSSRGIGLAERAADWLGSWR